MGAEHEEVASEIGGRVRKLFRRDGVMTLELDFVHISTIEMGILFVT